MSRRGLEQHPHSPSTVSGDNRRRPARERPIPADWRLIAQHDNGAWTLWHRPFADNNGWHSFVLRLADGRFGKKNFWGGYNGQRLVRNNDLQRLEQKHPTIYHWLLATCRRTWKV
jgi:hypothetical protein